MLERPKVTIGLPVFNGENYLASTIEAVLGQSYPDLELIIGDNGSTDGTESIGRLALADKRVRYERSSINRGATWNYNRLVGMARGEYFKWAAHDDLLEPAYIARCVEELERHQEAVLVYPRTKLIDEHGTVTDGEYHDGLDLRDPDPVDRFGRYLIHPGEQHPVFGLIRLRNLRSTQLIANCWGGDQVLLATLLLQGEFHEISERLFLRRYHPGTSLVANATPVEVARWFDPTKRGRTALPRTRLTAELLRVVLRSGLTPVEKLRCAAAVGTDWVPRYWRVMGGEAKRTVGARIPVLPARGASRT